MRETSLHVLDPKFRSLAIELLAQLAEAKIPVQIIQTLRTEEEHQEDLKNGTSWVKHSKHQDGLAIDICPFEVYDIHGPDKLQWDEKDPIWLKIGEIGTSLGLVWGGNWTKKDMGHFELKS